MSCDCHVTSPCVQGCRTACQSTCGLWAASWQSCTQATRCSRGRTRWSSWPASWRCSTTHPAPFWWRHSAGNSSSVSHLSHTMRVAGYVVWCDVMCCVVAPSVPRMQTPRASRVASPTARGRSGGRALRTWPQLFGQMTPRLLTLFGAVCSE